MKTPTRVARPRVRTADLQRWFLPLLPRVRNHAQVYFRHIKCAVQKEELVAECVALSWLWYCRLARRGKDAAHFASALATYVARAVSSGRRLCGQEDAKDALSATAQRRRGFAVRSLPTKSTLEGNAFDEALRDNTRSPVPEQVSFRCDFPAWRRTRSARDRNLIDNLMRGETTSDVARRFRISAARVSQLRREFQEEWARFCSADGTRGTSATGCT